MIFKLLKEYPKSKISEWLEVSNSPKSSHYKWEIKLENRIDKNKEAKDEIKTIIEATKGRYGYRGVTVVLKNKGFNINHKKVLRIMREESLLCNKFKTRPRKYSLYKGEIGKVADNLVGRQSVASRPDELWLADITEFRMKGEENKLYLSPILDLFNSEIISYTLSNYPIIELTNTMLEKTLEESKDAESLIIHLGQGFHYQHSTWTRKLGRIDIKRSMSEKGNCLNGSPVKNFFDILKQRMLYGEDLKSYDHLRDEVEKHIKWYSEDRIKAKLNGMPPVMYRLYSA